jgi:hypothetical protein
VKEERSLSHKSTNEEITVLPRRKFLKLSALFSSLNFLQLLWPFKSFAGGFISFAFVKKSINFVKDVSFKQVVLLLSGEGTNGAKNTVFIDSTSNNVNITRVGNVTQGSFSPYGNNWSVCFNNSSSHIITTPSSSSFALGTSDFTIELWFNQTSKVSAYPRLFNFNNTWNAQGSVVLMMNDNDRPNKLCFGTYNSGTVSLVSTTLLSSGVWYHVAVTRQGSTFRMFVNGVQEATCTSADNIDSNANSTLNIGNAPSQVSGELFDGFISNFRMVKGTALYSSNFTPSTQALTAVSGTVLLTCQSNYFKDNSSNNFALTISGTPKIEKFGPFPQVYNLNNHGGSGYFDGAGDFLTLPASGNNYLDGDFTIEAWAYPLAISTNLDAIFTLSACSTGWCFNNSNVTINGFVLCVGNLHYGTTNSNYSSNIKTNMWTHLACVRSGSTITVYANGVSMVSITFSSAFGATSNTNPGIGVFDFYQGANRFMFNGYISNLRLIKGTALYTSPFTPPTSPLSAITNTQFLCNFTNAGIYDGTCINNFENIGNVQISTTASKFGSSSIYFDGTAYLNARASNPLTLSGDYTIEGWANINALSGYHRILSNTTPPSDTPTGFMILYNNSNNLVIYGTDIGTLVTVGTFTSNTWFHFAMVRSGTTFTMYVNGTSTFTKASHTSILYCTGWTLGGMYSGGEYLSGYLDDIRVTKGVARYTANFTPPTVAHSIG